MLITEHAKHRYIERVDGRLTIEQAEAEIAKAERGINTAAQFGCHSVKLGNGAHLRLQGDVVVTVIGRWDAKPRRAA